MSKTRGMSVDIAFGLEVSIYYNNIFLPFLLYIYNYNYI